MKDEVDSGDGGLDVALGREGPLEQLDALLHLREIFSLSSRKIVEHPHAPAPLEDETNQMGSDEPGSAGHEIRGQIAAFLEVDSV